MPLSRRLSQFFSSSSYATSSTITISPNTSTATLSSPRKDTGMHTVNTKPTFLSTTSDAVEPITLEKTPIRSNTVPTSSTNRRPRKITIRKILNGLRFSGHSDSSPPSSPDDVEPNSPIDSNTFSNPERSRFESNEPIDFTAIQISFPHGTSSTFSSPGLQNLQSSSPDRKIECGDSGYYSLSSTHSLPPATLHTIRLLNRCIRQLEFQELLTTRFSTNLAYLFGKKEVAVVKTRKINDDTKELLIITLTKLRELVGKTMVHKMVWGRRSRGVVGELVEAVVREGRGEEKEIQASDVTHGIEGEMENLTLQDRISRTANTLRQDIDMQKRLDEVLRAGIVGSCGDERLMMGLPSRSERLCLRRFVGFVEGRVTELGGSYKRVERAVGRLEIGDMGSVKGSGEEVNVDVGGEIGKGE